jgi:hypothetical protein
MMSVRRAFVAASIAAAPFMICLPSGLKGQEAVRTVTLVPVAGFGKGVNWAKIFSDYQGRGTYKDLVRLSDGRMIVADSRTYNFLVFNADGKFVNKFWKRGRRDKENLSVYGRPEWISLWEDRLLFVSELGRIRVFDLSGKEIRSAKVDHPVNCFEALDEKTVAVAGWVMRKDLPNLRLVAVVDLDTEKETVVMDLSSKEYDKPAASYTTDDGKIVTVDIPYASLRPFVRRLPDGLFLAGFSHWPEVEVHDTSGAKTGDFLLKTPKNIDDLAYYEELNRRFVKAREDIGRLRPKDGSVIVMKPRRAVGAIVSPGRLPKSEPYYYNLNVDEAGKLRVFLLPEKGKNPVVQVYTPTGELIDQHAIDEGAYRLVLSPGAQGPIFAGEFLYALAEKKDVKGVPLRLMKFRLADK